MSGSRSQINWFVQLLLVFSVSVIILISTLTSNGVYTMSFAKSSDRKIPEIPSGIGEDRGSRSRNNQLRNETGPPSTSSPLVPEAPTNSGTGTLKVKKIMVNDGEGNKKPSDFTINVDGNNPSPQSFPGSSSGTSVELNKGRYSVTETGPTGYTSNPSSGCSGSISPDQERNCTITNVYNKPVPPTGKIIVTKQVVNDGGGNKKPSDFTINVDGNNPSPQSFPGSSSGTSVELNKGRYSVTETGPTGYTSNPSSGCSGSISPDQERNCTITNVYNKPVPPPVTTGKIIVTKQVVNDGGGNKKPSDFTINVDGNNPSPQSFPGNSAGSTVTLNPGNYQVLEQGPISSQFVPGKYTPSYSTECNGVIKAGETNNCIITNKYNPFVPGLLSKLIVTKMVINDGGGNKGPSDFTITVHGNNPSPNSFHGSTSGTNVELKPGRYSVTETGPTSRYTTDYSKDCSGNANANPNSIKCNITNVYQEPGPTSKLIVIKNVDNSLQGSLNKRPSDFAITVHGNNPSPRSFDGKSDSGISVSIYPGSYRVTEKSQSGYTVDYSADCEGNIRSGQTKVCIITNEGTSRSSPIILNRPLVTNITGFSSPYGVTTDTSSGNVYVTNYGRFNTTGTVSIINSTTNTITSSLPVEKNPQAVSYNSANGLAYIANLLSNTLSVVNGTVNKVVNSLQVGKSPGNSPSGIAINPINNTVYTINTGSNTVSVINGTNNQVKGYLSGFFNPSSVSYDPDNDGIYISNKGTNTVSIINGSTNSAVKTVSSGGVLPSASVYNSANGLVYVSNAGSNTVSILNTTTNRVVGVIPVGAGPSGIAYNPDNGKVYVANSVSGTISVINSSSNTVTNTIPVGRTPIGLAYNPINNSIYVANSDSNTVTVIKEINP